MSTEHAYLSYHPDRPSRSCDIKLTYALNFYLERENLFSNKHAQTENLEMAQNENVTKY